MKTLSSFDLAQAHFKSVPDADLYSLLEEFPSFGNSEGYSDESKLQLAVNKSALYSELYLRGLVPAN